MTQFDSPLEPIVFDIDEREFLIPPELHRERLDRALVELVPELSRNYLSQLVTEGAARLNGAVLTKPARRVQVGDRVRIELRPTPMSQAFVPQPVPLTVVHEDEHVLVIDKAVGLVVHPAPGHWGGTILNGLLARDAAAAQLPRAGIVHRLDKDTSGLLVVARSLPAYEGLKDQFSRRTVQRAYLALAHMPWVGAAEQVVDAPIGRDPRNRLRMTVVDLAQHPGKAAQTRFRLLGNAEQGCLLDCRLVTGRTHQIRVHLAYLGHALVGDDLYGGAVVAGLERQGLHARCLGFTHPMSGREMVFHAPIPDDMHAALAAWQLTIPSDPTHP